MGLRNRKLRASWTARRVFEANTDRSVMSSNNMGRCVPDGGIDWVRKGRERRSIIWH